MNDRQPTYFITLLRHGQSVGNANGHWQGHADFELTETGRRQAEALAEYWQKTNKSFDLAVASPLKRAYQTAEIVTARLGIPLECDSDWMERDIGDYTGLDNTTINARFERPAFTHPFLPVGRTGESQWALVGRAARALQKLTARPAGNYLIVAHGGILNLALYVILGISPQPNFAGAHFRFGNTGYAEVTFEPWRYRWNLETLNELRHLQGLETLERENA